MQIVLGVSMTPAAVRMVLVEGDAGDGVTVDTGVFRGSDDVIAQVLAATEGTRESATEGGHHLVATGVAWTDHAQAARLRDGLRARGIDDVVMVSELHAAGALAQAIGVATGAQRTAMLFLEQDIATLAVVRTFDGAVVGVRSHSLHTTDAVAELRAMVAALEGTDEPPQAVFVVGSGVGVAAVAAQVSEQTTLPVHAPGDAEFALARGAALAAAGTPRYEAATVGIAPGDDLTAAGITQLGYLGPLGYSAVPDDDGDGGRDAGDAGDEGDDDPSPVVGDTADPKPFLLVGSALASIFVVGVVSLFISLAVSIRPAVEQRPDTADTASSVPAPPAAPQTIQAPVPVVQQAPRTVFARPSAPAVAVAPQAPAAPAPAAVPAAPAAPPSVILAPAAVPAPVVPPVVLPPFLPALLPQVFQPPVRNAPPPRYPFAAPTYPPDTPPSVTPTTSAPPSETFAPTQGQTPSQTPSQTSSQTSSQTPSQDSNDAGEPSAPSAPTVSTTPVWPGFSG